MSTIVLAQGVAMTPIDSSLLFTPGEAAFASYAWQQLSTVGASVTLVNGAVTASDTVVVDDVTLLTVGSYYQFGSSAKVRLDWVDPVNNIAGLHAVVTAADNAQVKPVAIVSATIAGLSYNTGTGVLSGTPTALATTSDLFYRATDTDGVSVDSTTFAIQVASAPTPPVFTGLIDDEAFSLGDVVSLNYGAFFTGATSYSLTGTIPSALSFNTSSGVLSGTVTTLAGSPYGYVIAATNAAGTTQANGGATITLTVSPDLLDGLASLVFTPTGVLKGTGQLIGAATLRFTPVGVVTGGGLPGLIDTWSDASGGAVLGTVAFAFSAVGVLKGTGALVGVAALQFTATPTLSSGPGALLGSAAFAFSPSSVLTDSSAGQITGLVSWGFTPVGTLTSPLITNGVATFEFSLSATFMTEMTGPSVGRVTTERVSVWRST